MKKVICITMLLMLVMFGAAIADQANSNILGTQTNNNAEVGNVGATATSTGGSAVSTSAGGLATATGGSNTNTIGSASGLGTRSFSPSSDASATIERGAIDIDNDVDTDIDIDNDNINANSNRNENSNRNSNLQGQMQGQGQKQTAVGKVTTDVKVEGDEIKSYAIAFPSVSAAEGTSSGSATYLFGSIGKANTELYKKIIPQIQTVLAIPDDIMSKDEKKEVVATLVKKMTNSNRAQRFLGVFWEDNSKSLLNVFGLLTWDSLWAEGQRPLQCKSDMEAEKLSTTPAVERTVDTGITGNAGNVNQ